MTVANLIQNRIKLLPEPTQEEVLDFVNYLLYKLDEDRMWAAVSVKAAMRGLEEEEWPEYHDEDLKEQWA